MSRPHVTARRARVRGAFSVAEMLVCVLLGVLTLDGAYLMSHVGCRAANRAGEVAAALQGGLTALSWLERDLGQVSVDLGRQVPGPGISISGDHRRIELHRDAPSDDLAAPTDLVTYSLEPCPDGRFRLRRSVQREARVVEDRVFPGLVLEDAVFNVFQEGSSWYVRVAITVLDDPDGRVRPAARRPASRLLTTLLAVRVPEKPVHPGWVQVVPAP